jgi:hypothetical protein
MASVLAAALYNSPCAICSFIMQIAVDCFTLIDNTSEMSHILESHVTWCRPRRPQFDNIRLWPPPRFFFNVRNEEVLLRVSEQRNILHDIRKRKANWIGHILRRNCVLKQVIEGKIKGGIEGTSRRGSRRKKLLADLGDRRGCCHLKEALDRIKWRNRFGRGCGPVV